MDAEQLVSHAREYMNRGDFHNAKHCLKKAATLAPLRNDIRVMLAQTIEQSTPDKKAILRSEVLSGGRTPQKRRFFIAAAGVVLSLGCLFAATYMIWKQMRAPGAPEETAETQVKPEATPTALEIRHRKLREEIDSSTGPQAIAKLKEYIALDPPQRELYEERLIRLLFKQGKGFYDKKEYAKGVEQFNEAIMVDSQAKDPMGIVLYFWLGKACYYKGCQETGSAAQMDFKTAKNALLEAIELDPEWLQSYHTLAQTYIKLEDPVRGAEYFNKIMVKAPGSTEAKNAERQLKSMGAR